MPKQQGVVQAAGRASAVEAASIDDILGRWEHPDITKKTADFCITRTGRELKRFRVTGYLWRVKLSEDDGDYHLEITASLTHLLTRPRPLAVIRQNGYDRFDSKIPKMPPSTVSSNLRANKPGLAIKKSASLDVKSLGRNLIIPSGTQSMVLLSSFTIVPL